MCLSLREASVIVPRHDPESKELMIVHTRVVRYRNVQVHERHWCSWGISGSLEGGKKSISVPLRDHTWSRRHQPSLSQYLASSMSFDLRFMYFSFKDFS